MSRKAGKITERTVRTGHILIVEELGIYVIIQDWRIRDVRMQAPRWSSEKEFAMHSILKFNMAATLFSCDFDVWEIKNDMQETARNETC